MCGSAEVVGGLRSGGLMLSAHKTPPRFSLVMTRNDDHVQSAGAPQKMDWVTPKISLMGAGDTEGGAKYPQQQEQTFQGATSGPS